MEGINNYSKRVTICMLLISYLHSFAQDNNREPVPDPLSFGVVLDDPAMKNVAVKKDVIYLKDDKGSLSIDIYLPPQLKNNDKKPAIIFLNAIGERPGQQSKNMGHLFKLAKTDRCKRLYRYFYGNGWQPNTGIYPGLV